MTKIQAHSVYARGAVKVKIGETEYQVDFDANGLAEVSDDVALTLANLGPAFALVAAPKAVAPVAPAPKVPEEADAPAPVKTPAPAPAARKRP